MGFGAQLAPLANAGIVGFLLHLPIFPRRSRDIGASRPASPPTISLVLHSRISLTLVFVLMSESEKVRHAVRSARGRVGQRVQTGAQPRMTHRQCSATQTHCPPPKPRPTDCALAIKSSCCAHQAIRRPIRRWQSVCRQQRPNTALLTSVSCDSISLSPPISGVESTTETVTLLCLDYWLAPGMSKGLLCTVSSSGLVPGLLQDFAPWWQLCQTRLPGSRLPTLQGGSRDHLGIHWPGTPRSLVISV